MDWQVNVNAWWPMQDSAAPFLLLLRGIFIFFDSLFASSGQFYVRLRLKVLYAFQLHSVAAALLSSGTRVACSTLLLFLLHFNHSYRDKYELY